MDPIHTPARPGTALEVLKAFTRLGCSAFGGPIAHLGYFRTEFVQRRRWLDDAHYADLVALCQFLPGPTSSQVGMALGYGRAGWGGALAAWIGFTLPSAVALIVFALGLAQWPGLAPAGVLHGLKIAAVAIVAQALWGMGRAACTGPLRIGVAIGAAALVLAVPTPLGQASAIVLGALCGLFLPVAATPAGAPTGLHTPSPATGVLLLLMCAVLLLVLPWLAHASESPLWQAAAVVYRASALVFGGGHVVLPLLHAGMLPPGWLSDDAFMAGYGAAQAVPGPLFAFAAYLGALLPGTAGGWQGGFVLLGVIFLPAFLLVAGALPFWERLRQRSAPRRALAAANAAVVGLLAAAFYDPVITSAIHRWPDAVLALAALALLVRAQLSPVTVVLLCAIAGWGLR